MNDLDYMLGTEMLAQQARVAAAAGGSKFDAAKIRQAAHDLVTEMNDPANRKK